MLGSRALYHDGWKAVVFHPSPFLAYDGTDVSKPFDADAWELYHVAEDFAEVRDLAAAESAKLEQMKQLWWDEAAKYQVLPLNNQPGRFGDRRYQRDRHELHAGIGPLPEAIAPNLRGRKFFIAAELDVPASGAVEGAIVAHGGHSGGYVLFLRGRRLHYAYNFVGTEITVASASVELPAGRVIARVAFTPTATKPGSGGNVALFYGDVPVGEATIARTTPLTYGSHGFAVGYQPGSPICADLLGRAELTAGVLGRVVIESEGRAPRDGAARARVDLATQ
jgi:arylsulfatase